MPKILLVDDEKDFVEVLAARLAASGYEVVTAHDGVECLEKAGKEKPDLIILDVMMPKMDGYTALRELRNNPQTEKIPVIVSTAKEKMKDLFLVEGIKDYMIKPFDDKDMLARIKKAME